MNHVKRGNFSLNLNKLRYMKLLTLRDISQKLQLTTHFLEPKERKFDELRCEIARLRKELVNSNPGPIAVMPPPFESPSLNASTPAG